MTVFLPLDRQWQFSRQDNSVSSDWTAVDLPHTPFLADLNGQNHWLGICRYRRTLELRNRQPGYRYVLQIGAAMQACRVRLDGREIGRHTGGYLPFEIDLTDALPAGDGPAILELELDNRRDPAIPPGKPLQELDSCWYGGLYRDVRLRIAPPLHITDPVGAGEIAGGGLFARTLEATPARARVHVRTQVRNTGGSESRFRLQTVLTDATGQTVAQKISEPVTLSAGSAQHYEGDLAIAQPRLWSPAQPQLHRLTVTLLGPDDTRLDEASTPYGIRQIAFSRSGGFQINGQRVRLRGTNRLQEFPYVGYAAPRAAQFRDAQRIKEAGFDYIRLSHYPHSPDFLDACDHFGLVVMNCLPGWQFMGDETFRQACYRNAREMIRRDRNHPCVVLWELSLNETPMDDAFMTELQRIGHEEYPGNQIFTAGWIDRYDVFIHSRQHGKIHQWQHDDKALVVAEYGDWEFYANNAGFDQTHGNGLMADWSNSRKDRADGEPGMLRQAWNHMVALNDTLSSPAVLDGQWAVFDYARGYHPTRAKVGVMDVFRLPKFSYHLYRSQRSPQEVSPLWQGGPVVFIASHWTARSDRRVAVYSNCDTVELKLNGVSLGRQTVAATIENQYLPHPPFFFEAPDFVPGRLEAIAYQSEQPVATHTVTTPGPVAQLHLTIDTRGYAPTIEEADLVFVHALLCDKQGTLGVEEQLPVKFALTGEATLVSPAEIVAEAGIATAVVRVPPGSSGFAVQANLATLHAEATYAKAPAVGG